MDVALLKALSATILSFAYTRDMSCVAGYPGKAIEKITVISQRFFMIRLHLP